MDLHIQHGKCFGIGGYDGGYITYFSGKSKNDLDAIKKVTKDPDMTWKKFKNRSL